LARAKKEIWDCKKIVGFIFSRVGMNLDGTSRGRRSNVLARRPFRGLAPGHFNLFRDPAGYFFFPNILTSREKMTSIYPL
jgi:hypothetical protein